MTVYKHDEAQMSFKKGNHGSYYMIADMGTADTLKDWGLHHKRIPK